MKVLFLTSEFEPFAKTGGLADVSHSLPVALKQNGVDVRVAMPFYQCVQAKVSSPLAVVKSSYIYFQEKYYEGSVHSTFNKDAQLPVYLIGNNEFFGRSGLYNEHGIDYPDNILRFAFFCMYSLQMLKQIDFKPDVIHCNDWQSALAIIYLKTILRSDPFFDGIKTVYTIHNLSYQGIFSRNELDQIGLDDSFFQTEKLEFWGNCNLMKGGIIYADHVNAVSPTYSKEIGSEEFGCGLEGIVQKYRHKISGILNGIDTNIWNPQLDSTLCYNYHVDDLSGKAECKRFLQTNLKLPVDNDVPLIGMISRFVEQKGFTLILPVLENILRKEKVQFVFLGTGESGYVKILQEFEAKYPDKLRIADRFDNTFAHQIEAGADIYLMPSHYEPCGLNQLYSLRYGTIPIVRKVGGLADTIINYSDDGLEHGVSNGFVFTEFSAQQLYQTIRKALDLYARSDQWNALILNAMRCDFSWNRSADRYMNMYEQLKADN